MANLSANEIGFFEARLKLKKHYPNDGELKEKQKYLQIKLEHLKDVEYPRLKREEPAHIPAAEQDEALRSIISTLETTTKTFQGWGRMEPYATFLGQIEEEVQPEFPWEPSEGGELGEDFLLRLTEHYLEAANLTHDNLLAYRRRSSNQRWSPQTRTYEILARRLAELWYELTDEQPKISKNSGFRRFVNHFYTLSLGLPERGATSLKSDLASYFKIRRTS